MEMSRSPQAPVNPTLGGSLAKRYAPCLSRLLGLSRELDAVLTVLNSWAAGALLKRIRKVLRVEKAWLALLDSSVKMALQCRGGQSELIRQARVRPDRLGAAAHRGPHGFNAGQEIAYAMLEKAAIFGWSSVGPYKLSGDEIAILKRHIETSRDRARLARADQREVTNDGNPPTSSRSQAANLTHLLSGPEPDVVAVGRALEDVSSEMLNRTAGLLEDWRLLERNRKNADCYGARRTRAVIKLEFRRGELMDQCCGGILRCLGGAQRLLIEAEWRRSDEAATIAGSQVRQIVDRIAGLLEEAKNASKNS